MLLVFLGAGGGGLARWGVHLACVRLFGQGFPFGTVAVNILGCLAVGIFTATLVKDTAGQENLRLGLVVGFLGGFTTFSAFGRETFLLSTDGHTAAALANVLVSVGVGLLAVWLGMRIGLRLVHA